MQKAWPKFLFSFAIFALVACGTKYKENITPIYQAEDLHLKDVNVQYGSDIAPSTIDPSGVQKVTSKLLGWIPIVGQVVELPLDLTNALLPTLTTLIPQLASTSYPTIPAAGAWNDPQLLKIINNIQLGQAYIRITPRELRGANWKPEKCWVFFDCPDVEFSDFLKEVRVYLLFDDLKTTAAESASDVTDATPTPKPRPSTVADDYNSDDSDEDDNGDNGDYAEATPTPAPTSAPTASPAPASPQVLLASATTDTDYDKVNKVLHFNVSQENIRPYLDQYQHFKIKIVASGGYPKRKVYIDGRLEVNLELKLSSESP